MTEFLKFEGFEEIEVNENGDVRWSNSGKPYKLQLIGGRYTISHRLNDQNRKHLYVHRMVATLFVPNPDNYYFVKLIDGDVSNFKASNLMWVKRSGG